MKYENEKKKNQRGTGKQKVRKLMNRYLFTVNGILRTHAKTQRNLIIKNGTVKWNK